MSKYTQDQFDNALNANDVDVIKCTSAQLQAWSENVKARAVADADALLQAHARLSIAEKDFQEIVRLTLTKDKANNHMIGFITAPTREKVEQIIDGLCALLKSRIGDGENPKTKEPQCQVPLYLGGDMVQGKWQYRALSCLKPQDPKVAAAKAAATESDEMPD
jgi:hypothetical protein